MDDHTRRLPIGLAVIALLAFVLFAVLGTWQLQRRVWKHDLVERVQARIHATPVPPPGRSDWPALNPSDAEYRRVSLRGHFIPGKATFVQANTRLGPGFWMLSPLQSATGNTVLVNRGFVPTEARARQMATPEPVGEQTIVGLLRLSEPGGAFLRSNAPTDERWYSRDVAAIARARSLAGTAPYFVDAEASTAPAAPEWPRGGLTVLQFPDNHLVYAITWYGLAALVAWGARRASRPGEAEPATDTA